MVMRAFVQVHSCKLLLDPMVLANAVRRYETCWLPLVAAHAATRARSVIAPPLDVAWVWLLHALDPVNYAEVAPVGV
jgi:Glycine-rich domain-containing protein-like